jgi:hypothetical protein
MPSRRVAAIAAVTACTLLLVTGCSIPLRPVWWPKPKPASGAETALRNGHRPTPAPPAVPQVAEVWQPGMPQLGIDVYWVANTKDPVGVIEAKARRIINYAISLGSNSISLSFPFYTYGITSDALYGSAQTTPSTGDVAIFLAQAAQSHIRVTLRPLLNETSLVAQNPIAWRGSIEPENVSAWFESYQRLLIPYAKVAAAGGAATFVIGTELDSLESSPEWPGLITAVKAVYPGQLLYDQNFNEFANHDNDLPVPDVAVDAYPRFQLPDSASVSELASAWEGWLGTHRPAVLRNLVLSEVGIAAVGGAYPDPGDWLGTTHSPIDQAIQANWYQAVCRAASADHLAGLYFWEVSFDADPADPAPFESDRITFLGRAAQNTIKTCFSQLGS